jgi:transposase InsO family protein
MAEALQLSRSGYYAAKRRSPSRREAENVRLVEKIRSIHLNCRQVYGSPRMTHELQANGLTCSRNRVARLMRENGIAAKTKRKFKATTYSRHHLPVAPNYLQQVFQTDRLDRVWASDITYISTGEGWLYLAMIKDLCSKAVVGWAMRNDLGRELAVDAFKQAVMRRRPLPGLVLHSDRGVQYASSDFRELLASQGTIQSMSSAGSCYDNATSESFFATLKRELVYHSRFRTRAEAREEIFDYIEVFYNRQRLHSAIEYLSPAEFEIRYHHSHA